MSAHVIPLSSATHKSAFEMSVEALIRFYRAKGATPDDFIPVFEQKLREQRDLDRDSA